MRILALHNHFHIRNATAPAVDVRNFSPLPLMTSPLGVVKKSCL
jgi:hypothetical protein